MNANAFSRRIAARWRRACLAFCGMTLGLVLGGCTPEIQTAVLDGLASLSTAVIEAFFQSITPDNQSGGPA